MDDESEWKSKTIGVSFAKRPISTELSLFILTTGLHVKENIWVDCFLVEFLTWVSQFDYERAEKYAISGLG